VKVVYLDGAGSGAAVVDAFASLSTVDLKVQDDLTVTDDASVGGDLLVSGEVQTANIGFTDGDNAITISDGGGTSFAQAVTANAGVVIDNITIDGTEIDLSSGDLTLDVAGDIKLDAAGNDWIFLSGGTAIGRIINSSSDFVIQSDVQDKDIIFKGDDGGSGITALTIDMSNAGRAFFNVGASFSGDVAMGDNNTTKYGAGEDLLVSSDGTDGILASPRKIKLDVADEIHLDSDAGIIRIQDDAGDIGMFQMTNSDFIVRAMSSDKDLIFKGNDGGSVITALTLDMSEAGAATFGDSTYGSGLGQVRIINNANSVGPASFSLFGYGNVADDGEYAKIDAAMQLTGTAGQVAASISFKAVDTGENKSTIEFLTHDSSALTKRVKINELGQVGIGGTGGAEIQASGYQLSLYGDIVAAWFENRSSTTAHEVMIMNRKESDGVMIAFLVNDAQKGTISVSGGTVSYNAFMGSHYSESLEDLSSTLLGTVMETVDAVVENKYADQGRLAKCKVSDTSESSNVYGVWITDNDDGQIAALGASWCRINSGVTVSMGDLLVSNGDGTAKVQSDDIIRSKTIGKVASTVKKQTYGDGSYVVPVVLYCG